MVNIIAAIGCFLLAWAYGSAGQEKLAGGERVLAAMLWATSGAWLIGGAWICLSSR